MPKSHTETQSENQSGIQSELQGKSPQDSEPDFSAEFNADTLIQCYRHGIFPMSDGRDDRSIFLLDPEMRGILPLDQLHISKSMRKFMRKTTYDISFNQAFPDVIKACALCRDDTWISHDIEYLYRELFLRGHAHSVEIWDEERLIGGLYGVSQGGAFFGESMFSLQSKDTETS